MNNTILKQLTANATAGLMPAVADQIGKAITIAYWAGVHDGQQHDTPKAVDIDNLMKVHAFTSPPPDPD